MPVYLNNIWARGEIWRDALVLGTSTMIHCEFESHRAYKIYAPIITNGLGSHPLKVEIPVRIRLGVPGVPAVGPVIAQSSAKTDIL